MARSDRITIDHDEKVPDTEHPHHPRTVQTPPTTPSHPVPKPIAREARTHIFVHVVSSAKNSGPEVDEEAVRTVRGWRKGEELVEEMPRRASMAACFHVPSKKAVRGLSLKHM
jgi:hypothetical protein